MGAYVIRRILYAVPVILGVLVLIFLLFFVYAGGAQNIARQVLGEKVRKEAIEEWIAAKGLDKPLWYNPRASGLGRFEETLFYAHMHDMLTLNFGKSWRDGDDILEKILRRAPASLSVAVPTFLAGLGASVFFSLYLAFVRETWIDRFGTVTCVAMMSLSILIYIIAGQALFAIVLRWFPVSGYRPLPLGGRFIALPVLVGTLAGLGGAIRFGRTIMLEEISREYVRAARARGLSESRILGIHVLKNAMIPLLTSAVLSLPLLILGSLLIENFYGIPGLGSMGIEAIQANDFMELRALTFITAVLYQIGLILTDISYTLVDPRLRLR
ncbi:MAG: ABC transporter permease [Candidatus Hydrogenedentota bacterium]|nr:MAG: ABC transporter permease [Candidatus Hydrogenedentota bacterium]